MVCGIPAFNSISSTYCPRSSTFTVWSIRDTSVAVTFSPLQLKSFITMPPRKAAPFNEPSDHSRGVQGNNETKPGSAYASIFMTNDGYPPQISTLKVFPGSCVDTMLLFQ